MTDKLTKEQAAIIGVYTGISCGPFSDIQEKADQLLGRPTWTHEFGNRDFVEKLKSLVKPEFIAICYEEEKK